MILKNFDKIVPECNDADTWENLINYHLPLHGIVSNEQVACFIAQCAHESQSFNIFEENLNYSSQGLLKTFSKYFTSETAANFARHPETIANIVYANRMGNGDKFSGDGWKFRGRGCIQLTGRKMYEAFGQDVFGDDRFLDTPEQLEEPEEAIRSALWFWDKHQLSNVTDMTQLTKIINGGTNGLSDRLEIYRRAMEIIDQQ